MNPSLFLHTYTAPSVLLTLRTCHIEMSVSNAANNYIMQSLICPAPPSHPEISKDTLDKLIVPMPSCECPQCAYSGTLALKEHPRNKDTWLIRTLD